MKKDLILLLSNEPWSPVWYSKQHYANELSKLGLQVYFINPPNKWKLLNLFSWGIQQQQIADNLITINYNQTLPGGSDKLWLIRLNDFFLCLKLRIFLKKTTPIIWNFDPFRLTRLYFFNESKYIYHVVDKYLFKSDLAIAKIADIIPIVTKEYLSRYEPYGKKIIHIPHGISEEDSIADDHEVSQLNKKFGDYFLFVGTLHNGLDFELIYKISQSFPAKTILIVGPKENLDALLLTYDYLRDASNVIFVGTVPSQLLKNYIQASHICLIPYKMEQAYRTQTLKALHYFSQHKPIVSIPLKDWEFLEGQLIFSANTHEKFIQNIKEICSGEMKPTLQASSPYLHKVSYPKLIEQIFQKLEEI